MVADVYKNEREKLTCILHRDTFAVRIAVKCPFLLYVVAVEPYPGPIRPPIIPILI